MELPVIYFSLIQTFKETVLYTARVHTHMIKLKMFNCETNLSYFDIYSSNTEIKMRPNHITQLIY